MHARSLARRLAAPLTVLLLLGSAASARVAAPGVALAPQDGGDVYADPILVRGQLVDEAGEPVVGVVPKVHGWPANDDLIRRYGQPEAWHDPVPEASDAEGRFEFTLVPPNAYQFTVDVAAEGYGRVGWRWSVREYVDTEVLELGRTVLERPGVIEGHIEDADGELQVEGWRVLAWHRVDRRRGAENPRDGTMVHTTVDPETGTFRVEDLPPGRVELSASHTSGTRIDDVVVNTSAEQVTRAALVYRGPAMSGRIVLTIFTHPFYVFRPHEGHVHAVSSTGERHPLVRAPGRANDWHVVDLPEGVYALEIDDPRFEPWRLEEVRTGTNPSARLVGSAGLDLTILGPDGERVQRAGVHARFENATFSPDTISLVDDGDPLPPGGRFRGVVPGDWVLRIVPEAGVEQHVRVAGLVAGETRAIEVRLGLGGTIAGRVLGPGGSPLPGVRVQRTLGEVHGHDGPPGATSHSSRMVDGEPRMLRIGYRDAEVITDAQGRYTFTGLSAGPHAVRAQAGVFCIDDHVVDVVPGETTELDLSLPASGAVRVEVLLPEDVTAGDVRIQVQPADPETVQALGVHLGLRDAPDVTEPRRFEGLPVGEARVHLQVRTYEGRGWSASSLYSTTVTVLAEETVEHVVDLRETYPASGVVRVVRADGSDAPMQVNLEPVEEAEPTPYPDTRTVYGRLDEETGAYPLQHVPMGRYHAVAFSSPEGWQWRGDAVLTVESRTPFELELQVPFVTRTLRVVDAEGRPVADRGLHWAEASMRWTSANATTDAEGRLELHLPPGDYRLVPTPADHDPRMGLTEPQLQGARVFAFEAGDGEQEVVLGG